MSERLTGNQLWRLRTKHGRDKLFGDAALLLEEAYKYFDWCDRHPWEKVELVKYKGGCTAGSSLYYGWANHLLRRIRQLLPYRKKAVT
jgi:hypothetical protein